MIRLLRAELLRLRSRRMALVAAIVLLAAAALFQLAVNEAVTPPEGPEVAAAQREYERARLDWETNHERYEQDCLDQGVSPEACVIPEPLESDYLPEASSFAAMGDVGVFLIAGLVMLTGYLLGASFLGAEVSSGAMANWLSFVPRRGPVLASKLLVLAVVTAIGTAVLLTLTLALAAMLTQLHGGSVTGLDRLVAISGRAVVLCSLAAVLGACLALLTRHTVAAVGIVLGGMMLSTVLSGLASVLPVFADLPRWLPGPNLTAFLRNGTTYEVYLPSVGAEGSFVERKITIAWAAAYWGVLSAAVIAATALVFHRRDVP